MSLGNQVLIELIKTGFALIVLGTTWFVGQRILAYWEIKKKRKELDIATATQFQQLYGEYKDVWRLWKVFCAPHDDQITFPGHTRWELLKRATSAESKFEAIIVKMATERVLTASEARNIGLLRQGFQKLRESIRDGNILTTITRLLNTFSLTIWLAKLRLQSLPIKNRNFLKQTQQTAIS